MIKSHRLMRSAGEAGAVPAADGVLQERPTPIAQEPGPRSLPPGRGVAGTAGRHENGRDHGRKVDPTPAGMSFPDPFTGTSPAGVWPTSQCPVGRPAKGGWGEPPIDGIGWSVTHVGAEAVPAPGRSEPGRRVIRSALGNHRPGWSGPPRREAAWGARVRGHPPAGFRRLRRVRLMPGSMTLVGRPAANDRRGRRLRLQSGR